MVFGVDARNHCDQGRMHSLSVGQGRRRWAVPHCSVIFGIIISVGVVARCSHDFLFRVAHVQREVVYRLLILKRLGP
jgi:hypothetical protein